MILYYIITGGLTLTYFIIDLLPQLPQTPQAIEQPIYTVVNVLEDSMGLLNLFVPVPLLLILLPLALIISNFNLVWSFVNWVWCHIPVFGSGK